MIERDEIGSVGMGAPGSPQEVKKMAAHIAPDRCAGSIRHHGCDLVVRSKGTTPELHHMTPDYTESLQFHAMNVAACKAPQLV